MLYQHQMITSSAMKTMEMEISRCGTTSVASNFRLNLFDLCCISQ